MKRVFETAECEAVRFLNL